MTITAVDPVVIPPIVAIALGVAAVLSRSQMRTMQRVSSSRFLTIDGLRGYLAFAVFLHHSCIWYFYIHTGRWALPPSSLYTMLGQGGVALFFMVTSFLFTTKLLDSRHKKVDWLAFYITRIARLLPVYLVVLAILFILVALRSDFTLVVPLGDLVETSIKWLLFTIPGKPDINMVERTSIMLASVTWSLAYEWFFYLCLPFLAIGLGVRGCLAGMVFSVVILSVMLEFWAPVGFVLQAFIGGGVAALAVRNDVLVSRLKGIAATSIALCAAVLLSGFTTAYDVGAMVLLSLIFMIVAAGNSLVGLLIYAPARWLGELSYGIYMLHGIVLFIAFYYCLGFQRVISLQPWEYWTLVTALTPIVLIVSHFTHLAVERPALTWMRGLLHARLSNNKEADTSVS